MLMFLKLAVWIMISNRIIKLCAIGIHKPFTRLLNTSFRLGEYPNAWKLANVIPLFKKDNRQVRSNYRPISLYYPKYARKLCL
jgi:uncharacterized membrane protein YjgN (DUF898 family)